MSSSKVEGYLDSIWHWKTPQSGALFQLILEHWPVDEARLLELIELGAVYCQQHRQRDLEYFKEIHPEGTYVRIHSAPRRCDIRAIEWPQRKIFENENYLCIDKPSGIPSHPMVDNWVENALLQTESVFGPLYLTHRLDRATSGILLFAKNTDAQRAFNQNLQAHHIEKHYWAETESPSPLKIGATLRHWMIRSPKAPKKVLTDEEKFSHRGDTLDRCELRILEKKGNRLKIQLLTGRTHQIRAQLSAMRTPIMNDKDYGARELSSLDQIHLHSCHLAFRCPLDGAAISVHAPAPLWDGERTG